MLIRGEGCEELEIKEWFCLARHWRILRRVELSDLLRIATATWLSHEGVELS